MSAPSENHLHLLIVGTDDGPNRIIVCDSEVHRNALTIREIFGEDIENEETEKTLETLRDHGAIYFEGDPPVSWMDTFPIEHFPDAPQAPVEVCKTCMGRGMIGGHTGQTPESLDFWEELCPDCNSSLVAEITRLNHELENVWKPAASMNQEYARSFENKYKELLEHYNVVWHCLNGRDDSPAKRVLSEHPRPDRLTAAPPKDDAPVCSKCGNSATCFGKYENMKSPSYACNDCCGHCCEDGYCESINKPYGFEVNRLRLRVASLENYISSLPRNSDSENPDPSETEKLREEVIRYNPCGEDWPAGSGMYRDQSGEWVHYDDYETLKAERDRLRDALIKIRRTAGINLHVGRKIDKMAALADESLSHPGQQKEGVYTGCECYAEMVDGKPVKRFCPECVADSVSL